MKGNSNSTSHQQLLLDVVNEQCIKHSISIERLIEIIPEIAKAADFGFNVSMLKKLLDCLVKNIHQESFSIYLVYGENGEYSDYDRWDVCAFLGKEEAEKYTAKLNALTLEPDFEEEIRKHGFGDPYRPSDDIVDYTYSFERVNLVF